MAQRKSTSDTTRTGKRQPTLRERAGSVDPLVLAAAGVAAGAVVGALLPRSDAETRLLAPIGAQVNAAVGTLGIATRQALSAQLATVPVVGQIAADQLDRVLDAVVEPTDAEPAIEHA